MTAPLRLVLDSNVVASALLFSGGGVARVRAGWQSARFVPLASSATVQELARVLAYPKFGLGAAEQDLLALDGAAGLCPVLTVDAFCQRYRRP